MKVFLTGATGALGRRVLPGLLAAGHDVTAVARTADKAAAVRAAGGRPVTVDLFDATGVGEAVTGHDAVVNIATHVPPTATAALPRAWREHARIRTDASRNLVDAAIAAGAERYVQEALAFAYVDAGDEWVDEDSPLDGGPFDASVRAAEEQAARFTRGGGLGVVLRFGLFHGADSEQTRQTVALARRGLAFSLGRPDGYLSIIELDDAARAVVAALHAPAGVYNVVDDEPLTRREYAAALASAIGRDRPLRLPPTLVARLAGPMPALLARSERASNRRFRDATGWAPRSPSAREAWAKIVSELGS